MIKSDWTQTHKLLLLVGDQFGNFIFTGRQFFFVVREISYDKLLFACMQFELFNDLLEERHIEQCVVAVLCDQWGRARNNHVRKFLVVCGPIICVCSAMILFDFRNIEFSLSDAKGEHLLGHNDEQSCQIFRIQDEVLLLHQIGQIACQQTSTAQSKIHTKLDWAMAMQNPFRHHLRLLLFQILQIAFQIIVRLRLCFQIGINLSDLLRNDVGNVAQRLLDRVLGHIPLEMSDVRRKIG